MTRRSLAALLALASAACAPQHYFVDDAVFQWSCDGAIFEAIERGESNDVLILRADSRQTLAYARRDAQADATVTQYSGGGLTYQFVEHLDTPPGAPNRYEASLKGDGLDLEHCRLR
ncbi:MAG TPA: hypothetical protein VG841_14810 [Caulobacterales bacterium]|nr:hypothetical protein [Caulobacterales bacterium]